MLGENFAGTFNGQLSQLRFYKRPLNILELRNNLFVECGRYCVRETFGGCLIIQPNSELCGNCLPGCPVQGYLLHDDCFIITEDGGKIIIDEESCSKCIENGYLLHTREDGSEFFIITEDGGKIILDVSCD
jgi:ferredoxin